MRKGTLDRELRSLEELDEAQREAATASERALLVIAGAGSGKTRMLAHRIAWLAASERARPRELLAVTFTRKAARELRERVEALVGEALGEATVTTFHAACYGMLRRLAPRVGRTHEFSVISDERRARALAEAAIAAGCPDLDVGRAVGLWKARAIAPERAAELARDGGGRRLADAYAHYERALAEWNNLDVDDLLVKGLALMRTEDVRARYRERWPFALVDEYQDTNAAQYLWLRELVGEAGSITAIADDDQCLAAGTQVRMADATDLPIEEIRQGDQVLACYGSGEFRPARVGEVIRRRVRDGVRITTRGGRVLLSTPEHVHFAGFRAGTTPEGGYVTYLMRHRRLGWRVGMTSTYVTAERRLGLEQRCLCEAADGAWVVSTHETAAAARMREVELSCCYGLPMTPFKCWDRDSVKGGPSQQLIDELFARLDTESGARRLLDDEGLDLEQPHHMPQSAEGARRNVKFTLCADHRYASRTAGHRLEIGGRDREVARQLAEMGFSVRPARPGSASWRCEAQGADAGVILGLVDAVSRRTGATRRLVARLGAPDARKWRTLPFIRASSVRPGMAVFVDDGYDVVASVERVQLDGWVYDLNVEGVHNFLANGIVTHNCLYRFRGASPGNIGAFERDHPGARVVALERNYRSTAAIVRAAGTLMEHAAERRPKRLHAVGPEGAPVAVRGFPSEHQEAAWVAEWARWTHDQGTPYSEIAVLVRSVAVARPIEQALLRARIPHRLVAGTPFGRRPEVREALAWLELVSNPRSLGAIADCLAAPPRGLGLRTAAAVRALCERERIDAIAALLAAERIAEVSPARRAALVETGRTLAAVRRGRERERWAPDRCVIEVVRRGRLVRGRPEAERRAAVLRELVGQARAGLSGGETLPEFLARIALDDEGGEEERADAVTISTCHRAKGLEWRSVAVCGMAHGDLPHALALRDGGLEDERRVAYVAMTRARERLVLTYARRRGRREAGAESPFIAEAGLRMGPGRVAA